MSATLNTAITAGEDVYVTSVQQLGSVDTGPCIIEVAVKDPQRIEVGVRESITAAEIITAFSHSNYTAGMSGAVVNKFLEKNNIGKYIVPNNINGAIILGTGLATIDVNGDIITEIVIGLEYNPNTFELILDPADIQYLEGIGELRGFTISYIEKVVVE